MDNDNKFDKVFRLPAQYSLYNDLGNDTDSDRSPSSKLNDNNNIQFLKNINNINIITSINSNTSLCNELSSIKHPTKSHSINHSQKRHLINRVLSAGSKRGSILNLIVAIVGAGILAMPYAFRMSGIIFSIILLLICTIFSYYSLHFLTLVSDFLNISDDYQQPSYLTLSKKTGGIYLMYTTQIVVCLALFGSTISRMVGAGGIIVILYIALFTDSHSQTNDIKNNEDLYYKLFIISFSVIIIFPLSLMKNMSSLRFTSFLSVICSIFLTLCLIWEYFILCNDSNLRSSDTSTCFWNFSVHSLTKHDLFNVSWQGFFTSFPLFIFAYNCQPNLFPIYHDMNASSDSDGRLIKKSKNALMHAVIRYSMFISCTLYVFAGGTAFMTFLKNTCTNILLNNFHKSAQIVIASVIFSVAMILAVPVFINAIRKNIIGMIWGEVQLHWITHAVITIVILGVNIGISLFVSDIATVFGFIGSTVNPITGYILPAYFVWKLLPNTKEEINEINRMRNDGFDDDTNVNPRKEKIISIVLAVIVSVISVGSIYYKIYELIEGSTTACLKAQDV